MNIKLIPLIPLIVSSGHSAILIDNFEDGDFTNTLSGLGSQTLSQSPASSNTVGGQRLVRANTSFEAANTSASNQTDIGAGNFTWSVSADTTSNFALLYGFSGFALPGNDSSGVNDWINTVGTPASYSDLNLDLSNESDFNITIDSADVAGPLRITLISDRTGALAVGSSTVTVGGGIGGTFGSPPITFNFPFSDFGLTDFSDIDQIIVDSPVGLDSADWSLTNIETVTVTQVPEPSSLAFALLGSLLMVGRRRR